MPWGRLQVYTFHVALKIAAVSRMPPESGLGMFMEKPLRDKPSFQLF